MNKDMDVSLQLQLTIRCCLLVITKAVCSDLTYFCSFKSLVDSSCPYSYIYDFKFQLHTQALECP